jgi:hypothetical protein
MGRYGAAVFNACTEFCNNLRRHFAIAWIVSGVLAALLKQALDINSAAAGVVFYRSTTRT